jgi:hypothetical protein
LRSRQPSSALRDAEFRLKRFAAGFLLCRSACKA